MPHFYFEHLTSPAQFLALADEWNPLLAQSPVNTIFLTWEWLSVWWQHFGADYRPWLITARERPNGRLLAVAPLMMGWGRWKGWPVPLRELQFIGSPIVHPDHLDLIVADGDERLWQTLLTEIGRRPWEFWRLASVPAGSPTLAWLRQQLPPAQRPERPIPCPFIPLPADWQTFRGQLGKNHRRNIQRYDRYLAEAGAGPVSYGQLTQPKEISSLLTTLARLHQAVQAEQGHLGAFHDPRVLPFQLAIAHRFFHNNWLRLYWLRLGDQPIALMYCFLYERRLSFYITGYELEWGRFGPGRQLIAHAISDCIANQVTTFDFLRGDESYKFDWTATTQSNVYLRAAGNWLGRLLS